MCEFFAHDLPSKMAATATVFRVCDSDIGAKFRNVTKLAIYRAQSEFLVTVSKFSPYIIIMPHSLFLII